MLSPSTWVYHTRGHSRISRRCPRHSECSPESPPGLAYTSSNIRRPFLYRPIRFALPGISRHDHHCPHLYIAFGNLEQHSLGSRHRTRSGGEAENRDASKLSLRGGLWTCRMDVSDRSYLHLG